MEKPSELREYKRDKKALIGKFFTRIDDLFEESETEENKELLAEIVNEKINPLTLRQGK